jgi:hypothetical protein
MNYSKFPGKTSFGRSRLRIANTQHSVLCRGSLKPTTEASPKANSPTNFKIFGTNADNLLRVELSLQPEVAQSGEQRANPAFSLRPTADICRK